jgi:hypothetical protein
MIETQADGLVVLKEGDAPEDQHTCGWQTNCQCELSHFNGTIRGIKSCPSALLTSIVNNWRAFNEKAEYLEMEKKSHHRVSFFPGSLAVNAISAGKKLLLGDPPKLTNKSPTKQ